jgi:uncharacterized lipoprotein YddW (UPF0748 family)
MSPAGAGRRCAAACALAVACFIVLFGPGGARAADAPPAGETRALWVLRSSLTTPASIAALVRAARDNGFNTLLVQVRGRGDAYYRGGLESPPPDLLRQPESFDPLATVLAQGRAAGLRVHAWVNVNLVSSAAELPASRDHIVYRHPAWLMVPRDMALELSVVEPESPAYVGRLARWTRNVSTEVEGLYSSPIVPAAAAYTESIVRDIARRYELDGIHLDYARYPNERFDYSKAAVAEFRAFVGGRISDDLRRTLDAREAVDPLAYPDALTDHWRGFRVARMSALIGRLRDAVKDERPAAMVTVATAPDLRDAYERKMQDWRGWLERGLVDGIAPMAYTVEPERFAEQIAAARDAAGGRTVWAGIGAWRLSPRETIQNIQTARQIGVAGIVLFSYDSLTNPRQVAPDYLETVSRGAFAHLARQGSPPEGSR